jgi:hypothetical protein
MMNKDGTGRTKLDDIETFYARFNRSTTLLGYITFPPKSQLVLYNWKNKTKKVVLEEADLANLF